MINYSSAQGIERFTGVQTLVLDHNNFGQLRGFPQISRLENLSLAYNQIKDLD